MSLSGIMLCRSANPPVVRGLSPTAYDEPAASAPSNQLASLTASSTLHTFLSLLPVTLIRQVGRNCQYPAMSSSHRLFRFPKPQWLNSPNTRTAGVYVAGAVVSPLLACQNHLAPSTLCKSADIRRPSSAPSASSSSSMPLPTPGTATQATRMSPLSTGFPASAARWAC